MYVLLRTLVFCVIASSLAAAPLAPALITNRPANIFRDTEEITFIANQSISGPLEWRILDWNGDSRGRGFWTAEPAGTLTLRDLPIGYYEIEIRSGGGPWSEGIPFAKVASPAPHEARRFNPFAVDAAHSLLSTPRFANNDLQPANAPEIAIQLYELLGTGYIRERTGWNERTNPSPGAYNWGDDIKNAQEIAARTGSGVLNMFEGTPKWARDNMLGVRDHMALFYFSQEAAKRFGGAVAAWEFWNEVNHKPYYTVWDYATALKVAQAGFKSVNENLLFLGAALARPAEDPEYLDLLLRNDAGRFLDVISFHSYAGPEQYLKEVSTLRAALATHKIGPKPIWLTETGYIGGTGERAPLQPGTDKREHGQEQARRQAERLVTAQVSYHLYGVDRVFAFVVLPMNEKAGKNVWGMLRWDWLVKPAFVAQSALNNMLGNSRLLGRYATAPSIDAVLFEQAADHSDPRRRGKQTLVLWSAESSEVNLPLSGDIKAFDLMGSPLEIRRSARGYMLSVGPSPIYLDGIVNATAEPQRWPEIPKVESVMDKDIVLGVKFPEGLDVQQRYVVVPEGKHTISIEIHNLGERAKEIRLLGEGSSGVILGLPALVNAAPAKTTRVTAEVSIDYKKLAGASGGLEMRIGGRSGNLGLSGVMVPLRPDLFVLEESRATLRVQEIDAGPQQWAPNSSGKLTIDYDLSERATRFNIKSPPRDFPWVYPNLRISLTEKEKEKLVGVSFEVKSISYRVLPSESLVMILSRDGFPKNKYLSYSYPMRPEWTKVRIPFAVNPKFNDLSDVEVLRVGCNPRQEDFTYWVRNVQLHFRQK